MISLREGDFEFHFPRDWSVVRPSAQSFYKHHFQRFCGSAKEVDFIAYDPGNRALWLIESKDYRVHHREKPTELVEGLALKVRDTLALLVSAGANDSSGGGGPMTLHDFWLVSRQFTKVKVALHCELPRVQSKLFPQQKLGVDLIAKMNREVRVVDPHPLWVTTDTDRLAWSIKSRT